MATCTRIAWKVLSGCQRQLLRAATPAYTGASQSAPKNLPVRTFAAVKAQKKLGNEKNKDTEDKKEKTKAIDNQDRHKPYGYTLREPVDDVYVTRYYPKPIYGMAEAINMLKHFQKLDFTPPEQPLYIDLQLNMQLEKKRKVDGFVAMIHLPYPFRKEMNKVLVFTEDPNQVKVALENGAAFAGGDEIIQQLLDDQISADFYVAVPEMISKILPLKNKLRKKFPKSNRGSVSFNIVKMLETYKMGHSFGVESECYIRTQIATLDMPTEQILANLQTMLTDIRSRRPADMGPFVERAIIASHTSEALLFNSEDLDAKSTSN